MANEEKHLSSTGLRALRRHEGAVLHYYNDIAKNCTYGVGTLVHHGACTPEELRRPVTPGDVDAQLQSGVRGAETAVRRRVRNHDLTQAQFDALVSFTYNVGAGGAGAALDAANRGANAEVIAHLNNNVWVHPRDPRGRPLPPIRVPQLVNRRRDETAPFQGTTGAR